MKLGFYVCWYVSRFHYVMMLILCSWYCVLCLCPTRKKYSTEGLFSVLHLPLVSFPGRNQWRGSFKGVGHGITLIQWFLIPFHALLWACPLISPFTWHSPFTSLFHSPLLSTSWPPNTWGLLRRHFLSTLLIKLYFVELTSFLVLHDKHVYLFYTIHLRLYLNVLLLNKPLWRGLQQTMLRNV